MRSKRDIKMGRLCMPGGAVLEIVGGGVTFRFLNGEAILDENMLFWVRLYALVVVCPDCHLAAPIAFFRAHFRRKPLNAFP